MSKSATDVMQDIVFSSVVDAVAALKAAAKGVPNALLRDLGAIGPNTVAADLPPELQAAIATAVRNAFNRLRVEGYAVSPTDSRPPVPPPPRPRPQSGARPGAPSGGPRPRPGGGGGRPGRPPKPTGR